MFPIQWKDTMSVGVAVIDADHKRRITMLNTLFDGVREGKGKDAVGAIVGGLIEHIPGSDQKYKPHLQSHGIQ